MNYPDRTGPARDVSTGNRFVANYPNVPPFPFALCPQNGYYAIQNVVVGAVMEWVVSGFRQTSKWNPEHNGFNYTYDYMPWIWDAGAIIVTGSGELTECSGGAIVQSGGRANHPVSWFYGPDEKYRAQLRIVDENTIRWTIGHAGLPRPVWELGFVDVAVPGKWADPAVDSFGWGWPPDDVMLPSQFFYPHGLVVHSFEYTPG